MLVLCQALETGDKLSLTGLRQAAAPFVEIERK
jgi:hypothetical protein